MDAAPEPTDAWFTMRGLLIGMAVAAAMAALGGAFLRRFSPEAQSRLLIYWMVWLAATVAAVAYQVRRRVAAERLAGRTILRLELPDPWTPFRVIVVWPLLALFMLYAASMQITESWVGDDLFNWSLPLAMPAVYSVLAAAYMVPAILWRNQVRFCENGVLSTIQFVPWTHVTEHRWSDANPTTLNLRGLDIAGNESRLNIPIRFEQRMEVQAILHERCPDSPFLATGASMSIGQMPLSTVIRTKHYRWHVWGVLAGALCAFATFYWGIGGQSGVREFDQSFVIGIFASGIGMTLRRQRDGQKAGAPFIRLFARRDILGFVSTFTAAIGLYLLGTRCAWPYALPIYAAGLGCAYAMIHVMTYYFLTQLDLCENGLAVRGACFWPWPSVRLVSWDRENNGQLVLARGWQRVVGFAAPEQRDAVDALLKQKLPDRKIKAERDAH